MIHSGAVVGAGLPQVSAGSALLLSGLGWAGRALQFIPSHHNQDMGWDEKDSLRNSVTEPWLGWADHRCSFR